DQTLQIQRGDEAGKVGNRVQIDEFLMPVARHPAEGRVLKVVKLFVKEGRQVVVGAVGSQQHRVRNAGRIVEYEMKLGAFQAAGSEAGRAGQALAAEDGANIGRI